MYLKEINHLAFITEDIVKTIRYYRDLLGMRLTHGVGHDGFRHYFFKTGNNYIAFFEHAGARTMRRKFPGKPTSEPVGFDHVSISVASKEDLFALKDRLEAAGIEVHGAVDHGFGWSIYFFDNNNIPLEATWEFLELTKTPAMAEEQPLAIVAEGAEPQPGVWPEVSLPTPPERMVAHPGNGYVMRETFLKQGLARTTEDFGEAAE